MVGSEPVRQFSGSLSPRWNARTGWRCGFGCVGGDPLCPESTCDCRQQPSLQDRIRPHSAAVSSGLWMIRAQRQSLRTTARKPLLHS